MRPRPADRRATRRLAALLPLLLALPLAGCEGQWVEEEEEVPPKAVARANPLLAAGRLCEALGREVEFRSDYRVPAERDAVLFLPAHQVLTWDPRAEDLLAWVDQGGQLVVTVFGWEEPEGPPLAGEDERTEALMAQAAVLERSPLMQELGVGFSPHTNMITTLDTERRAYDLRFPALPGLVDLDGRARPERAGDDVRADLLRYDYGAGCVTVLSCGELFTNDQLGQVDNGTYLWRLVSEDGRRGPVQFVRGERLGFFGLLARRADAALLSLLLLVGVWLLHAGGRLGPLLGERPPERREFHEHVLASGRFLWSRVGAAPLLEALRARALRRCERHVPRTATTDPDAWVEQLAQRTGEDPQELRRALFPTDRDTPRFVRTAQALQRLDDSL